MNIMEYLKEVSDYIDSLNDEEFYDLLIECGLERCPLIERNKEEDIKEKNEF